MSPVVFPLQEMKVRREVPSVILTMKKAKSIGALAVLLQRPVNPVRLVKKFQK